MTDAIQTKLLFEIAELIDEGEASIPIDIIEFMLGTMTLDQLHQLEDFITNHYGEQHDSIRNSISKFKRTMGLSQARSRRYRD